VSSTPSNLSRKKLTGFWAGNVLNMVNHVASEISRPADTAPLISVIVLNYNGAAWLERCLDSLHHQTLAGRLEVIVADNASPDRSDLMAAELMQTWPNGRVSRHGINLGYAGGNNRAAEQARGRYLFFLNNDTWLEADCLERLLQEVQSAGAAVAAPQVMDYLDGNDSKQAVGGLGFDIFGLISGSANLSNRREVFIAAGCSLLIEAEVFRQLGGFDAEFFMYADEYDLCWRVWLAGHKVIWAPSARLHHRGAAAVNPRGQQKVLENRTSDTKRFYANRNNLLVLFKNCQHVLLITVPLQLLLLTMEASFMALLTRRWSHIRRAYAEALWDCWRLRRHILAERRRLRRLRRRGDFWMLRFLCARFNRWDELRRFRRFGLPKVDHK
jgi:GT2 family glycosyltransferase